MSTITEERIQRIEARVTAVEQAQNDNTQSLRFIVTTAAQMKAVQDDHGRVLDDHSRVLDDHSRILEDHSQRLGRIESMVGGLRTEVGGLRTEVDGLRTDVGGLRAEVHGFRKELPTIVADVMREVLRERR